MKMINSKQKKVWTLTHSYILALSCVAIISFIGQLLIQLSINDQIKDSYLINEAGRQRFRSQEIVKLSLLIFQDLSHKDYGDKPFELIQLCEQWKKAGWELKRETKGGQFQNQDKTILKMYDSVEVHFSKIQKAAIALSNIAHTSPTVSEKMVPFIIIILENERPFLLGMDKIVNAYDREARNKVLALRNIELFLFILTLAVLVLEVFLIFRPAAKSISNKIHEIIQSEKTAGEMAQQLRIANASLEKSNKELKDISFAVDQSAIISKTDKYGVITFVNDKFCEISQYKKEELIGNRFYLLSGFYHSKSFFDKMWETISSGKVWNDEIKNKAKDGSYFWLDTTIVPVLNKNGVPVSYIAIYNDISLKFRQTIKEQKIRSASLIEGQEKERKKIARELHDGLGQNLTALKFHIEGLKDSSSKIEETRLEDIRKILFETIVEVRRISFNLMPSVLSDFGIIPTLKHLSEQISRGSKVKVIFENNSSIERLNKTVEINLYRIVQEAMNNAIKYSEADEILVNLSNNEDLLYLLVEDNGIGFNTVNVGVKNNSAGSGNGIRNIQERTSLINGEFRIETAPGRGTKIMINIPLKN